MTGEGERSMAAVLQDIVGNVQQIVGAEIRLARIEVRQEVEKATRSVALLIVGGTIAALALALVLLACVYALSMVVAPWGAALIVAGAAGAIGGVLMAAGMKQMRRVLVAPPKTVATMKENLQWTNTPTK
jgi:uncharacterized membrane protein YqjE